MSFTTSTATTNLEPFERRMVLAYLMAVRWRELLGEKFGATQGYIPIVSIEEVALKFYANMSETNAGGVVANAFQIPNETLVALHQATEHALELERARRERLELAILEAVDSGCNVQALVEIRAQLLPPPADVAQAATA